MEILQTVLSFHNVLALLYGKFVFLHIKVEKAKNQIKKPYPYSIKNQQVRLVGGFGCDKCDALPNIREDNWEFTKPTLSTLITVSLWQLAFFTE